MALRAGVIACIIVTLVSLCAIYNQVFSIMVDLDSGLVVSGLIQSGGRTFKSTAFTEGTTHLGKLLRRITFFVGFVIYNI